MIEHKDNKGTRTVQRSIDIINCFTIDEYELSLTQISERLGLAKSTTSRLLDTLLQNGIVQKNNINFKYTLGYKMYDFGRIAEKNYSVEIRELTKPFMEKLRNETEESVTLYMLQNKKRVCIERCSSNQSLSHVVRVGETLPLAVGAGGKALLAFQTNTYIQAIIEKLEPSELKEQLIKDLPFIKEKNFALSMDERGAGINAISSAIYDKNKNVTFCLCVSGPNIRFTLDKMESFKDRIKEYAEQISEKAVQ